MAISPSIEHAVFSYKQNGIYPGSLLEAVICNDLNRSIDFMNKDISLIEVLNYVKQNLPPESYGNTSAFRYWTILPKDDREEIVDRFSSKNAKIDEATKLAPKSHLRIVK